MEYFSELLYILADVWVIILVLVAYISTCVVVVVTTGLLTVKVFNDGDLAFNLSVCALFIYVMVTIVVVISRYAGG